MEKLDNKGQSFHCFTRHDDMPRLSLSVQKIAKCAIKKADCSLHFQKINSEIIGYVRRDADIGRPGMSKNGKRRIETERLGSHEKHLVILGFKRKRQGNNAPRLTMSRRGLTASRTLYPANIGTPPTGYSTGKGMRYCSMCEQDFFALWGKGKPPVTAIVIRGLQHAPNTGGRQGSGGETRRTGPRPSLLPERAVRDRQEEPALFSIPGCKPLFHGRAYWISPEAQRSR